MNYKVKIDVISFFMWLFLLLQVKFFWLVPGNLFYSVNGNQQQFLMILILLVSYCVFRWRPLFYGTGSVKAFIIFFLIYYFFELTYSVFRNGQGFLNAFIASNFYLFILFYFYVLFFLIKRGVEKFYRIIITVSSINVFICWLQYFTAKLGFIFTRIDTSSYRFGTVRIGALSETVTSFGLIICFTYFLENKRNMWFYFLIFLIGFLGNIFVSKGRISILALIVGCLFSIILKYRKHILKIILVTILFSGLVLSFSMSSIGKTYLNSFENTETDTGSVRARELDYYNNQTKNSPIFGVGFIRDINDTASVFLKGPTHQYSRTDIGIFGLANSMGVISVIWYIMLTINLFTKIIFVKNRNDNDRYNSIIAYMMYSIICIPTMIFLNPFSITSEAILMGVIDYYYLEGKQKSKNV